MIKKKTRSDKKKVQKSNSFPVVAIGASAGGVKAVSLLFKYLPDNTGMAYIYVQHLNPHVKSILPEILARTTKMKVQEIDDMELMKPNNVYVIPYDKGIKVTDGHIKLIPRAKNTPVITIDVLFASLAKTHQENVIGIILSGNGNDGTVGLKKIKEVGGITIVQDNSAQSGSMPQSAIEANAVDFVLSPQNIARKLTALGKNGRISLTSSIHGKKGAVPYGDPDLKTIFELIHKKTGVDFSHYKVTSTKRRINHKMQQSAIHSMKDYAAFLVKNPKEINGLYKEILINVTSFFRDTENFNYLKKVLLPKLLKSKLVGETLRLWIAACSTGEEAYSIAILIAELQDNSVKKVPVQIFATDLSEKAIQFARNGEYTPESLEPVSKKRLKRFFTKKGNNYCVIKEIREMCVFAPHNILTDPPFFRIDFVSCRNLLIYFDASAQKKALSSLHFGLKEGGFLMLGKSETIGTSSNLFTQAHVKFKIFSPKKNNRSHKLPDLLPKLPLKINLLKAQTPNQKKNPTINTSELDEAINVILLNRHMPGCAVINKDMEIIQFRGLTAAYLSHPSGKASLNILKMMRPEFSIELRNAVHDTIKTNEPVIKSGIEIAIDSVVKEMSIEVSPLPIEWEEPLFLIVFTVKENVEKYITTSIDEKNNNAQKDLRIKKLSEDINRARAEMLSALEAQEIAYEELQAASEEIVSTNEEFQTLNEELETSKEEIEATNEELISTNQELQIRNALLEESHNYSQAIIDTIYEPMIILNGQLVIKSANAAFYKKFQMDKQETEGVFLFDLGNKQWQIEGLHALLLEMLSKGTGLENFEVTHCFPKVGEKVMLMNANRIVWKTLHGKLILLAMKDITERSISHRKEKEFFAKDIQAHEKAKQELEIAVKHRTRQLEKKNAELESANKDLTTFTYVSSHDLQEPLRKIQNFVTYIQEKEEKNLSDDGRIYFQRMHDTAQRMQTLIEDLLTYSRAKTSEHVFERINLQVLVDEEINNLEESIKEKKAIIETARLCEIKVISFQFRQLLHNLFSNSLKFSRPRIAPHIHIRCKQEKGSKLAKEKPGLFHSGHGSVTGKLSARKNYCHIIYSDNGIGFDQQYSERIFEVFQRLYSYQEYKGTGIGLAICKRIVENHKGMITASGKINKGARFDIYIPVVDENKKV